MHGKYLQYLLKLFCFLLIWIPAVFWLFFRQLIKSSAFSALMLLAGRQKGIWPAKTEWWGTGVVICLEQDANDLRYGPADATATPSSIKSRKVQNGLPFWCWLTQVFVE